MIGELTAHLWQSTFFAVAAGLLTLAFRGNRAQVRYWLWLSASLKFFVPLALLMSLGNSLQVWAPATRSFATATVIAYTMEKFGEPLLPERLTAVAPAAGTMDWIPGAVVGLWLCGFLVIALIRFRSWLRVRHAVRASSAVNIPAAVEIRVSSGLLEPGVVGLLRPILLLPEGISERLTPSELKAVLAHELCHVRRHDNLYASIHMIVETIFWFHPVVWWIGARLVEERERACDEEVLRLGNQPDVYADAILSVCKLYVESPLACVSGVSGASIRRRIEVIMSNRRVQGLNRGKKFLLAVAGAVALAGPIAIGLIIGVGNAAAIRTQSPAPQNTQTAAPAQAAPIQRAQAKMPLSPAPQPPRSTSPAPKAKFDVVSIRPCEAGTPVNGRGGSGVAGSSPPNGLSGYYQPSPGRLNISCGTLMSMINVGYDEVAGLVNDSKSPIVGAERIRGVPAWAMEARYTIEATTNDPAANATDGPKSVGWGLMMHDMLQSLLEDRFRLRMHRDTEEIPMYALTVAKGGLKMKPAQDGDCQQPETGPGGRGMIVRNIGLHDKPYCGWMGGPANGPNRTVMGGAVPLSRLADFLGDFVLDRHVIDRTGISDKFVIRLEYMPDESTPCNRPGPMCAVDTTSSIPLGSSIFSAIEQQLGLKLESIKGPHEFFVIDHVERPSEN